MRPESISSTKPFSSPSLRERARNSGRVRRVMKRVMNTESGIVTANTRMSSGEMVSIIYSEPTTVTTEDRICTTSCASEVDSVSMS